MKKSAFHFFAVYGIVCLPILFLLLISPLPSYSIFLQKIIYFGSMIVITVALAKVVKIVIKKPRPKNAYKEITPYDTYAFPSAHAAGVTAATLLFFSEQHLLGMVSLLVSLFVIVSRVKTSVHDTYDMIGGIVLAVAMFVLLRGYAESFSVILSSFFL